MKLLKKYLASATLAALAVACTDARQQRVGQVLGSNDTSGTDPTGGAAGSTQGNGAGTGNTGAAGNAGTGNTGAAGNAGTGDGTDAPCLLQTADEDCDGCQQDHCSAQCGLCQADTECRALVGCVNQCPKQQEEGAFECLQTCLEGVTGESGALYGDIVTCRARSCIGRCPDPQSSGTGDGGAGGTGGTGHSGTGGTSGLAGGGGTAGGGDASGGASSLGICRVVSGNDACDACVDENCGAPCAECNQHAECDETQSCVAACTSRPDRDQCTRDCTSDVSDETQTMLGQISVCIGQSCTTECDI